MDQNLTGFSYRCHYFFCESRTVKFLYEQLFIRNSGGGVQLPKWKQNRLVNQFRGPVLIRAGIWSCLGSLDLSIP